jgi:RecA/RadA recombinase
LAAVTDNMGEARRELDYFRALAELVGVRTDEGQSMLAGQYRYLTRVPEACVLAAYLKPGAPLLEFRFSGPLIYPFGMNASQKAAVETAFRSQVTIVQGPPGTGKTQTILNMVANAIRLGQTVAIVSNNNAATRNVSAKLEREGLGFLLATLGSRANKTAFIAEQDEYPEWLHPAARSPEEMGRLDARIASLTMVLDRLIKANNDRAMLAARVAAVRHEADLHGRMAGPYALPHEAALKRWTAGDLLALLVECEEMGSGARLGVLNWFKGIYRHGFSALKVRRHLLAAGPVALRSLYYGKHLAELQAQLAVTEGFLAEHDFLAIQREMGETSWMLLRAGLAERFSGRKTRTSFLERDLWSRSSAFLNDYPVVLSTTHSLKTSLAPDCLYDLVIVDEASQVDVATGVLALSCARRMVIVGDEKQLPNVIDEATRLKADEVWATHQPSCQAWNYTRHSLLSSAIALWPRAPSVLLREHYRCHPRIVGFFNHKFYDDKLIAMTTDSGESDVMQVVFTVPGNHARDRINQRQIDVITQEVLPLLREAGVTDIGIIAPYRAQVGRLRDAIGEGIEVDTVHGFQGREKQAIIVSTVDNEIGEFVDDAKLLNVAVSRAQRRLCVVMAAGQDSFTTNFGDLVRYIRHHQQQTTHSQVRSVFDLLYKGYESARREFLRVRGRGSIWDSENLAEAAIWEVLGRAEFAGISLGCIRHAPVAWLVGDAPGLSERERRFVVNPWSHVDFLIYDTIGKLPLVCVEVDGWAFHRPGSLQAERDDLKNAVFQRAGLLLIRLSTTGSGEAATISGAIRQALGLARNH